MLKNTKFYFVFCILGILASSGCDVDTGVVSVSFVCGEGAKKCDNTTLMKCENNQWTIQEDCPLECNKIDENNAKCGDCKSGDIQCDENDDSNKKYKLCQNGEWRTGEDWTCSKGCFNGECRECNDDFCNPVSEQYFQCMYGKYKDQSDYFEANCSKINTTCESSYCENGPGNIGNSCEVGSTMKTCKFSCNGNTCGECINESKRCIEKDNKGKLIQCVNGSWSENLGADDLALFDIINVDNAHFSKNCNDWSCNTKKTDCGVCYNGETRCTNNQEQICENGEWEITENCTKGCSDNKCIEEQEQENCTEDSDCPEDQECNEGLCVDKTELTCPENCPDNCDKFGQCVTINKCADCSVNQICLNGECHDVSEVKCNSNGRLSVGDEVLSLGINGVSLSENGTYGCINNKAYSCQNNPGTTNTPYDLKKFNDSYGCANDTDIFKCAADGKLKENEENNFCGKKNNENALFACLNGNIEYFFTKNLEICNNNTESFKFADQYIYCFNKSNYGYLFEFINNKLFLSKLDISCINFTDCSCDIDGYGSKKCYHHYNNTKKFCFYQKNDIERYYCNCKEYVQLNCPSGTFNEDSDKNYRCM